MRNTNTIRINHWQREKNLVITARREGVIDYAEYCGRMDELEFLREKSTEVSYRTEPAKTTLAHFEEWVEFGAFDDVKWSFVTWQTLYAMKDYQWAAISTMDYSDIGIV